MNSISLWVKNLLLWINVVVMLVNIANKLFAFGNYTKIKRLYCRGGLLLKLLLKIYWFFISQIKGFQVSLDCEIADNCVFPHGLNGIFISAGAKIGSNAVIFHQVTIGSKTLKDSKGFGAPVIGQNVYIGCGAKIIGNVRIGNNVRIGANCVVTHDVEDNITVVLPQPRILKHRLLKNNSFVKLER